MPDLKKLLTSVTERKITIVEAEMMILTQLGVDPVTIAEYPTLVDKVLQNVKLCLQSQKNEEAEKWLEKADILLCMGFKRDSFGNDEPFLGKMLETAMKIGCFTLIDELIPFYKKHLNKIKIEKRVLTNKVDDIKVFEFLERCKQPDLSEDEQLELANFLHILIFSKEVPANVIIYLIEKTPVEILLIKDAQGKNVSHLVFIYKRFRDQQVTRYRNIEASQDAEQSNQFRMAFKKLLLEILKRELTSEDIVKLIGKKDETNYLALFNQVDKQGKTQLRYAVESGNTEIVSFLLKVLTNYFDISELNTRSNLMPNLAGSMRFVNGTFKNMPSLNVVAGAGDSMTFAAASQGWTEMISLLEAYGITDAEVVVDSEGKSALHRIIENEEIKLDQVKNLIFLLPENAFSKIDNENNTAMHLAVLCYKSERRGLIPALLERTSVGAINSPNKYGKKILDLIDESKLIPADEKVDLIDLLIDCDKYGLYEEAVKIWEKYHLPQNAKNSAVSTLSKLATLRANTILVRVSNAGTFDALQAAYEVVKVNIILLRKEQGGFGIFGEYGNTKKWTAIVTALKESTLACVKRAKVITASEKELCQKIVNLETNRINIFSTNYSSMLEDVLTNKGKDLEQKSSVVNDAHM